MDEPEPPKKKEETENEQKDDDEMGDGQEETGSEEEDKEKEKGHPDIVEEQKLDPVEEHRRRKSVEERKNMYEHKQWLKSFKQKRLIVRYVHDQPIYLLFNPWHESQLRLLLTDRLIDFLCTRYTLLHAVTSRLTLISVSSEDQLIRLGMHAFRYGLILSVCDCNDAFRRPSLHGRPRVV